MALCTCPSCTVIQDISIVELPPHFSICLSMDLTTQIGGYIAFDWSYMFFRTIYGTKDSIKTLNHMETYTPSPVNMNCTIHEEDEGCITHEHATLLIEVSDYLLDEWANTLQINPIQEAEGIGLGTYCMFEEGAPIPNLMKTQEDTNGLWNMFFDGSRNKNCSGSGIMLVSPSLEKYHFSYRLQFICTNNVVKYEALIQGLQRAQRRGIKLLKVFRDSELVVNKIRNQNVTKNNLLKSYKHRVWDLLEGFQAFDI